MTHLLACAKLLQKTLDPKSLERWQARLGAQDPQIQDEAYRILTRHGHLAPNPAADTHGFSASFAHKSSCSVQGCLGCASRNPEQEAEEEHARAILDTSEWSANRDPSGGYSGRQILAPGASRLYPPTYISWSSTPRRPGVRRGAVLLTNRRPEHSAWDDIRQHQGDLGVEGGVRYELPPSGEIMLTHTWVAPHLRGKAGHVSNKDMLAVPTLMREVKHGFCSRAHRMVAHPRMGDTTAGRRFVERYQLPYADED